MKDETKKDLAEAGKGFGRAMENVVDLILGDKPGRREEMRREACEKLGIKDKSIPCDKPTAPGWHCVLHKGHDADDCCLEKDPPAIAAK